MIIDHLAVAGETLDAAVAHIEEALGVEMGPGGQHPRYGTHNRLIGLEEGLYLEAIAIEPGAEPQERPRWFDLDRFSGPARLTNWIMRAADLQHEVQMSPEAAQRIVNMQRGDLRWLMTVPADGRLPFDNCYPAALQWLGPPPASRMVPSGCRLTRLVLSHPEAEALTGALARVVSDERLVVERGRAALRAEFETPHGIRVLE